jgi:hypothetical protein
MVLRDEEQEQGANPPLVSEIAEKRERTTPDIGGLFFPF